MLHRSTHFILPIHCTSDCLFVFNLQCIARQPFFACALGVPQSCNGTRVHVTSSPRYSKSIGGCDTPLSRPDLVYHLPCVVCVTCHMEAGLYQYAFHAVRSCTKRRC